MIPTTLFKKFCCQSFIASIKVINMTRQSCKTNESLYFMNSCDVEVKVCALSNNPPQKNHLGLGASIPEESLV